MWLAPLRAVGDLSFYREATTRSLQWLFGYVVYLGLLFSLLATAAMALKVSPLIQETVAWASASIPPITFAGGKVSMGAPGPLRLEHPKAPGMAIAIDTNRTVPVTAQEMQEQKLAVYLTQSTLYLWPRPDSPRIEQYDLSKTIGAPREKTVLDAAFFRAVGDALPKVLYPLTFFLAWMVFIVWKLAVSMIYTVLALAINGAIAGGLELPELWRLAVVAQTPVVLLQMAQLFLPAPIPLFTLIAFLVVGVYLWQGIKQNGPPAPAVPS